MDLKVKALLLLLLRRRIRSIIENKNESQFNLLYNLLRMYDENFINYSMS